MNRTGASQYIESSGPQDAALIEGFRWLIAEAQETENKGLVAVSAKQNLDNIANWSQLGPLLTQLRQNSVAQVQQVTIGLFTAKDKGVHRWDGPILAIYGGQKLLDAVDSIAGSAKVLYVPWSEGDHTAWADTWGATKLGDDAAENQVQEEPTRGAVLVALTSLTNSVNLNSGIVHPSDREAALRTLETLFHKNADVTPELIRQQLIRLGWQPKDATDVRKLAEMIWHGRHPKGSKGKGDDDLWGYWQSKVN